MEVFVLPKQLLWLTVGVKASLFGNDHVMHSCLTHLIFCTVHVIRSELIKI